MIKDLHINDIVDFCEAFDISKPVANKILRKKLSDLREYGGNN